MKKVAILDDYQKVALRMAPWGDLSDRLSISVFHDHVAQTGADGVEAVDREDLFRRADVLSLHLPLTPSTRGLVDAAALALMKPDAVVVNTARGPLLDEAALAAALKAGTLGGAALDVFAEEPLPDASPLRGAPNVLLTPHLGYVIEENYRLTFGEIAENLEAWLAGKPIRVLTTDVRP